MIQTVALLIMAGTALAAVGMWLLLPGGKRGGRAFGLLLCLVGAGLLIFPLPRLTQWGPAEGWSDDISGAVFLTLAGVTIVSAVCAVSLRSPVYCAIWFALTLLGTAGLFLFQGAQFLGVATVVVYAGAILVTFLFVLMLAQPEGHAYYDRISWEALLSATTGAVMVGVLTMMIAGMSISSVPPRTMTSEVSVLASSENVEEAQAEDASSRKVLQSEHVAGLGSELFSRHLISVEVAGVLLFVALVGAVAIVAQEKHGPGGLRTAKAGEGAIRG